MAYRWQWRWRVLAVLLALGLSVRVEAAATMARLRVMHAAPGTGAVDVFIDGTRLITHVGFKHVSEYLQLPAGDHRLTVVPAGAGEQAVVVTQRVHLDVGTAATVAVIGLATVRAQVYTDDVSAPPPGKARVRVIHASPDAPAADVDVVNGPALIHNLAFPDASAYLQLDAGSYDLEVIALGDNSVFLRLPQTQVVAGTVDDIVLVGRLATISTLVATFTPAPSHSAPALVSGAGGSSKPVTPRMRGSGRQSLLPRAGRADPRFGLLLGLALCALAAGKVVRRRAAG